MQGWKKALIIGSLTAGALLILKGRRPAGMALAAAGTALLAAEYPDAFERIWEKAPEYVYRGTQIFSTFSRIAERIAQETSRVRLSA